MPRILTDAEISTMLADPKPLPENWQARLRRRPKSRYAYTEAQVDVTSNTNRQYGLILRGNRNNPVDFSVILIFEDADGVEYILRRHNGVHPSRHTNLWEKARKLPNTVVDVGFHIHFATERYQLESHDIDGYAELASGYSDLDSAVDFMFVCASFKRPTPPPNPQLSMPL